MKTMATTIPAALIERRQWVLWKRARGGVKLPCQVTGRAAKSNDPTTWCGFESATKRYNRGGFDGVGYVFAAADPFVGIDLDGCRNPETGEVAAWATEIIQRLGTYAEVSPSKTGVKLWVVGKNPLGDKGRKVAVVGAAKVCDKEPAIEVYDRTRYFAVTGWRLDSVPATIERNDSAMKWIVKTYLG